MDATWRQIVWQQFRASIDMLENAIKNELCRCGWIDLTRSEALAYDMRHVQHHAAQLNLLLPGRERVPAWVRRTHAKDS